MVKILCIEDGADTQVILKAALKGYELRLAGTIREAKEIVEKESFDLLVIDVSLPDGSGLDFFADRVDQLARVPVVFLTVSSNIATKAAAFTLGAEDYLTKPFDPKELRLRVDARLRRVQQAGRSLGVVTVGTLVCDLSERRAYDSSDAKSDFHLTTLEFKLLVFLAKAPNRVYSRGEIIGSVWGDSNTTERSVDVHISHIRKKIASTGIDIVPVVGSGYRLASPR